MADNCYSTKRVSKQLLSEVLSSIKSIEGWGSIEIFIQNFVVTQITEKNIKKPNGIVKKT